MDKVNKWLLVQYSILISCIITVIIAFIFLRTYINNEAESLFIINLIIFILLMYPARLAFIYCKKNKTLKKLIPFLRNREIKRLNNLNIEELAEYYKEEKYNKELTSTLKGKLSFRILTFVNSGFLLLFQIIEILFGGILLFGFLFYHLKFDSFRFSAYLILILLPLSILFQIQIISEVEYKDDLSATK